MRLTFPATSSAPIRSLMIAARRAARSSGTPGAGPAI